MVRAAGRLHPQFGIEVTGVRLSAALDDTSFTTILNLYFEHGVLLFRGQNLTPATLAAFSRRWGRPKIAPRKQFNHQDVPEVMSLGNIVGDEGEPKAFFNRQGVEWHSDTAGNTHIDNVTFLYAVEVPSVGGDTLFCSMAAAYEALPRELKDRIEGLRVLHSFNHHNDKVLRLSPGSARPLLPEERAQYPDIWHELVQVHPINGRRLYYVSEQLCRRFAGMTEAESEPLKEELVRVATAPERVYRHRWSPGDLLLWDNRASMHSATEINYEHERRHMLRASTYTDFAPRYCEPWAPGAGTVWPSVTQSASATVPL
jgi:alpha-ketoglutarate-dependent taurine dioxygenase